MIEAAMNALRAVQSSFLAKRVVYRRAGGGSVEMDVVPGRTVFRSTNDYGAWVRTQTRDFVIPADQIPFMPGKGDVIVFMGREFEVLAPYNEPVWRWSDPFHTAIRVHTKHTGGET